MAAEQGKLNDVKESGSDKPNEGEGQSGERSARIKKEIDQTRARMDQTVDEIESRMKPRHLVDELLGAIDTPAGREKAEQIKERVRATGARVAESVRANPVPALLIGAGVAWLILGGAGIIAGTAAAATKTHGPRRYPRPNARYADDPASDEWYDQNEGTTGLDSRDQRRRGVIASARDKVSHAAESVRDRAYGAAETVRDRAYGAAETVREKAHDATEAVRSHLPNLPHLPHRNGESHPNDESYTEGIRKRYREVVNEAPRVLREAPRKVTAKTSEFVHEQPLAAGAAALAAGLALGLLLPTTHREEEIIGENASRLRRRVRDTGKDLLERGKHVAQSAAQAAMEAADREGLNVEAAKEKVAAVATEAKNAAVDTAKKEGLGDVSSLKEKTEKTLASSSTSKASGSATSGYGSYTGSSTSPGTTPGSTTKNPATGGTRPSGDSPT